MESVSTLKQTEAAISGLSTAQKKKLLKWLERDVDGGIGISKTPGVVGGAACIRNTRIAVWMLYQYRHLGLSEAEILRNYPGLTANDLVNAWNYADRHRKEIEKQIAANEQED
jgi:uncharacterized protein (DUF433 family)